MTTASIGGRIRPAEITYGQFGRFKNLCRQEAGCELPKSPLGFPLPALESPIILPQGDQKGRPARECSCQSLFHQGQGRFPPPGGGIKFVRELFMMTSCVIKVLY
jgi:hypothetical protein